jgi:hypothetical protein
MGEQESMRGGNGDRRCVATESSLSSSLFVAKLVVRRGRALSLNVLQKSSTSAHPLLRLHQHSPT